MSKKNIIIATIKSWNIRNGNRLKKLLKGNYRVLIITRKEDLDIAKIKRYNPEFIFFPHWSWIIPSAIYENYEAVVFHMTDLPYGRGGSPLQNLITRGIKSTKISALKVVRELDAGPIYLKTDLALYGSAEDVYRRASAIVFKKMIPYMLRRKPIPIPQRGKVTLFKRRRPEESRIPENADINMVYEYIRMLDAEGYPAAFIEKGKLRLEFKEAIQRGKTVMAKVTINRKEGRHE